MSEEFTAFQFQSPPNAPALVLPARTRHQGSVQFSFVYSDGQSDPMTEYALRISADGGPFEYWDGAAFVATETFLLLSANDGDTVTVSVPSTEFTGRRYEWSAACKDAENVDAGPYAVANEFLYAPPNSGWGAVDIGFDAFINGVGDSA